MSASIILSDAELKELGGLTLGDEDIRPACGTKSSEL